MLKRLGRWLRRFFLPPTEASLTVRILPYAVLGVLTLVVLVSGAYAWDYTNSPQFCGTTCHTMPPEYTAYLTSPHARVDCVDCHIGRGFIATRITRKAGDIKHIISLRPSGSTSSPSSAGELRPARETCERCHSPEKFSDDSLRRDQALRRLTAPTPPQHLPDHEDRRRQPAPGPGARHPLAHREPGVSSCPPTSMSNRSPYVRVVDDDGAVTEYVDIEAGLDPASIDPVRAGSRWTASPATTASPI